MNTFNVNGQYDMCRDCGRMVHRELRRPCQCPTVRELQFEVESLEAEVDELNERL